MEENEFKKEILTMDVADENTQLHFIKEAAPIKDLLSDPFYPANNLWRRRPPRHESEKELTNRFAAYLKHVALILKAVRERKQDVVSFEFSKGPIQIYNGGIGIYSFSTVPDSWKACFFDDADALRAYGIYWKYLSTHGFNGAATGSWTEDDYNILLSIYAGLQTTKAKDLH